MTTLKGTESVGKYTIHVTLAAAQAGDDGLDLHGDSRMMAWTWMVIME